MILLLALVSCRVPDRDLYVQASHLPPDQALPFCADIRLGSLRGECNTHAAAALAASGRYDEALRVCDAIDDPLWREECGFLAADEAALVGDVALRACSRAGRYRSQCIGHAIGREVKGVEERHGALGQEEQLHATIAEVVARYKPNAPEEQRRVTVDTIVARIIASRSGDQPFDVARCGRARPGWCERAYRVSLDGTPVEIDIAAVCRAGPTREGVAAAGARTWAEGSEDLGLAAWSRLCDDLAAGRFVRDVAGNPGLPPGPPPAGSIPGDVRPVPP